MGTRLWLRFSNGREGVRDLSDIVQDGVTGCLFDPESYSSFCSALNRLETLLADESIHQTCRVEFEKRFSRFSNFQKLKEIYQAIGQPKVNGA